MKQVINDALRRALARKSTSQKAYQVVPHESALQPGLDLTGFNRLADELEDQAVVDRARRNPS